MYTIDSGTISAGKISVVLATRALSREVEKEVSQQCLIGPLGEMDRARQLQDRLPLPVSAHIVSALMPPTEKATYAIVPRDMPAIPMSLADAQVSPQFDFSHYNFIPPS